MNILVIGNGFDLAHGLPTRYGDFLEFVKVIRQVKNGESLKDVDWGELNPKIKEQIIDSEMDEKSPHFFGRKQCKDLLNDNIWVDYFLQCNMYQKENWIDFESEISNVIQSIDGDMHGLSYDLKLEDEFEALSNSFFNSKYSNSQMSYKRLRNVLDKDLNKLIRVLELYLCAFVSNIENIEILCDIKSISIDNILSFNYTDTYKRIYDPKGLAEYDYIHGKAERKHSTDTNNMVLGIDEYLSEDRKNRDIDFIAFKKYYQRIYKKTGCKYKDWIEEIRESRQEVEEKLRLKYPIQIPLKEFPEEMKHNLYIYGHSLDVTDKDILRELILNDNVYTIIYYHKTYDDNGKNDKGRTDLGSKIANLVKVIGQDELIRRTGGSTKTIEFRLQQDMVEI